jgi:hypothetical protein
VEGAPRRIGARAEQPEGGRARRPGAGAQEQRQLLALLSAWTSRRVSGAAGADGVDAALALLPALQGLAPAPRVGAPATWTDAVWLHSTPPGDPPPPWRVPRKQRMASRAAWMSRISLREHVQGL